MLTCSEAETAALHAYVHGQGGTVTLGKCSRVVPGTGKAFQRRGWLHAVAPRTVLVEAVYVCGKGGEYASPAGGLKHGSEEVMSEQRKRSIIANTLHRETQTLSLHPLLLFASIHNSSLPHAAAVARETNMPIETTSVPFPCRSHVLKPHSKMQELNPGKRL